MDREPKRAGDLLGKYQLMDGTRCLRCKADIDYPVGTPEDEMVPLCDTCDAEAIASKTRVAEEKRTRAARAAEERWRELAGDYHDTDGSRLPLESCRALVGRWGPGLRFGATLLGSAAGGNTGRSRTLWALIRKAHQAGVASICRPAAEFRQLANTLARHGEGARGIDELVKIPLLAIDDFGLQSFTTAGSELFGLILEKRTKHGRPTLLGSPVAAKSLAEAFGACGAGAMAGPFLRRIGKRHAWTVDATNDTLTAPER